MKAASAASEEWYLSCGLNGVIAVLVELRNVNAHELRWRGKGARYRHFGNYLLGLFTDLLNDGGNGRAYYTAEDGRAGA